MSAGDLSYRAALSEVLLNAASDGLVAINKTGKVVMFNPAAGYIFGIDPESIVGKSLEPLFVPGMFVEHQK